MNPYRSLMGLLLAFLLPAASAAAATLPKKVLDDRTLLISKQVSEHVKVPAVNVVKELNGLRGDPTAFDAKYASYVKLVDDDDKSKGSTKGIDERDLLLAGHVSQWGGGDIAPIFQNLKMCRTMAPYSLSEDFYNGFVRLYEQAIIMYEQANVLAPQAAVATGKDAKSIEKELKGLYVLPTVVSMGFSPPDPKAFQKRYGEYQSQVAAYNEHGGKTSAKPKGKAGGLDPDVAEWIKKAAALYPKMDQTRAGQELQQLKTLHPDKYANLTAKGAQSVGQFLNVWWKDNTPLKKKLLEPGPGSDGDPKGKIPESVDGKPVDDQTDPLDPKNDKRPILKVLEAMLTKDPKGAGAAMAARFGDYLVNGDEKRYVSPELRKDDAQIKALSAAPQGWVDAMVAGGKSGRVALLYYSLGTGGLDMSWAKSDPALVKALPKDGVFLADLVREMKPWTGDTSTGKKARGPLSNGKPETVLAFLEDAADNAKIILDKKGAGITKDMVIGSIDQNDEGGVVPGGSGTAGKITGPIQGFGMKELYYEGGVRNENVHQINDPYGVGRDIVIKMFTVYQGGKAYNKIGIYDVSNSGDVFGRKFDIASNGAVSFKLDDRVPGMPEYKLEFKTVGSKTEITFGRSGKSEPEHQIKTSVSELYEARAKQAALSGGKINVDGQDFLVLGQGGAKGGLLFFPADFQKRYDDCLKTVANCEKELTPSHIAVGLNERLPDGRSVPVSGTPALIGAKIKDSDHRLVFDETAKAWKVEAGTGTMPVEPVTAPVGGSPGGGTTTPTSSTGNTGTTSGDPSGGKTQPNATTTKEMMTNQVVQQLLAGDYEVNKEVQAGLSPEIAETFMVLSVKPGVLMKFAKRHYMTVPGSKLVGLPIPKSDDGLDKNERQAGEVLGFGKYLMVKSPNGDVSYFDLTDADENRPTIYKSAGSITGGDINELADTVLFDAAHDYYAFKAAGFTAAEAKTAFDNLRQALVMLSNPAKFQVSGKKSTKLMVIAAGKTVYFWPKVEEAGTTPKDDKTSGTGTAYDASIQGADVEPGFPVKKIELSSPAGASGHLHKSESGAALYGDDADPKKSTRWWLVFTYVNEDGAKKQSRPIMVFDGTGKEDLATFPGFEKLHISGTTKQPTDDVAHKGGIQLITGSDANKGKGVYGAFVHKDAGNVRSKEDNCMGPVVWWGVSDEEAQAACDEKEL